MSEDNKMRLLSLFINKDKPWIIYDFRSDGWTGSDPSWPSRFRVPSSVGTSLRCVPRKWRNRDKNVKVPLYKSSGNSVTTFLIFLYLPSKSKGTSIFIFPLNRIVKEWNYYFWGRDIGEDWGPACGTQTHPHTHVRVHTHTHTHIPLVLPSFYTSPSSDNCKR